MEQALVGAVIPESRKIDYVENRAENCGNTGLEPHAWRSRGWEHCSTLGGAVCCALKLV